MIKKIALFILATALAYPFTTIIWALESSNKELTIKTVYLESRLIEMEKQNAELQVNMDFLEGQLEEKLILSRSRIETFQEIESVSNSVSIDLEERNLFEKVIEAEFTDCSYEAKLMGATVIMNRLEKNFGKTIKEVLLAPKQFSVVENNRINEVEITESTKQAVEDALAGKRAFDENILYFWADWLSKSHPLWKRKVEIIYEGTVFAY